MTLPYAVMCELRALAGKHPSANFICIGSRRPSPQAMQMLRVHRKSMSAVPPKPDWPPTLIGRREFAASLQDLVDMGLIKHGFLVEGEIQTKHYGFHLTEKAIEILKSVKDQGK